jgi:hypothetical protein
MESDDVDNAIKYGLLAAEQKNPNIYFHIAQYYHHKNDTDNAILM